MTLVEKIKEQVSFDFDTLDRLVHLFNGEYGKYKGLPARSDHEAFFDENFRGTSPYIIVQYVVDTNYDLSSDFVRLSAYGEVESVDSDQYVSELEEVMDEVIQDVIDNIDTLDFEDYMKPDDLRKVRDIIDDEDDLQSEVNRIVDEAIEKLQALKG